MNEAKVKKALEWANGYLPHLRGEYLPEGADCLQTLVAIAQVFRNPPMLIVSEHVTQDMLQYRPGDMFVMNDTTRIEPIRDWHFPELPIDTAIWRSLSNFEARV